MPAQPTLNLIPVPATPAPQQDEEDAAAATGDLPPAAAGTPPAELAAALRTAAAAATAEASSGPGEAADAALRHQPKHVFVFSTAGKPIYAYRNDEAALAGLMATAEAILSVAHSKGHTLRHVRCVWVPQRCRATEFAGKRATPVACPASLPSTFPHCAAPSLVEQNLPGHCCAELAAMCLPFWSGRRCAWWACQPMASRPPYCACRWGTAVSRNDAPRLVLEHVGSGLVGASGYARSVTNAAAAMLHLPALLRCVHSTSPTHRHSTLRHTRLQLSLVHGQIVSLLTASALTHMFERNPGYDARRLLGEPAAGACRPAVAVLPAHSGTSYCLLLSLMLCKPSVAHHLVATASSSLLLFLLPIPPAAGSEGMLCSLIDSFTATPAALLGAYPSLPLLGGVRQALLASLGAAVKVRRVGGCTWVASAGLSSGCASQACVCKQIAHLAIDRRCLPLPAAGHRSCARCGCGGRRRGGCLPRLRCRPTAAVGPAAAAQLAVLQSIVPALW